MYKRAIICQPMKDKTDAEILVARKRAVMALSEMGCDAINSLFLNEFFDEEMMERRGVIHAPLCMLASSLEMMSMCNVAYFCKGWEDARGCRIEHEAAKAYGLDIIYEE